MTQLENISNDTLKLVKELETILVIIDKSIIATKRNGQNRTIQTKYRVINSHF